MFQSFSYFGHFMSTPCWVDMECPNFFLAPWFSVPTLSLIFENSVLPIFSYFGHSMSARCWVDVECPNFFLVHRFSVHFLKILYFQFSAILGILCPLLVEWMWNVLIFFGPLNFLYLHLAWSLHFLRILYFQFSVILGILFFS